MEVGEVLVKIQADISGLRSEVEKAVRSMDQIRSGAETAERRVRSSFDGMAAAGRRLASTLGVAFTVREIIQFTGNVVALGGRLTDLSERTGISASALSGYKSLLEQTGSSVESFATSISMAQKNLGEIKNANDPAAQAVKFLKLELDDLRNMHPDQFIEVMVKAVGGIENPMARAAVGAAIFGRAFRDMIPFIEQARGKMGELKRSGMDPETIALLDQLGDAWTEMSNKIVNASARAIQSGVEFRQKMIDAAKGALQFFKDLPQMRFDHTALKQMRFRNPAAEQRKSLDTFLEDMEKRTGTAPKDLPEKPLPFAGFGDASKIDAIKNAVESFIASIQKQGDSMRVAATEMDSGAGAARRLAAALELDAFKRELKALGGNLTPKQIAEINRLTKEFLDFADAVDSLKMQQEAAKQAIQQFDNETAKQEEAIRAAVSSMNEWETRMRAMNNLASAGVTDFQDLVEAADSISATEMTYQRQIDSLRDWQTELEKLGDTYSALIDQIQNRIDRLSTERAQARTRGLLKASPFMEDIDLEAAKENRSVTESLEKQYNDLLMAQDRISVAQQVLGSSFNGLSERISNQRQVIDNLISQGYGPLSTRLQEAVQEFNRLQQAVQNQQAVVDLVNSIGNAIDQTISGIIEGSQSFEQGMRNLARNMLLSFANEFNKLAVINPLKNAIFDMLFGSANMQPKLPTLAGLFQGFGGAATSGIGGAASGATLQAAGTSLLTAGGSLTAAAVALEAAAVTMAGGGITGGVSAAGSAAGSGGFFSGIWSWLSGLFAHSGGYIPQYARGGGVPAILDPGEFVLRKSAVNKAGVGKIAALNETGQMSGGTQMLHLTTVNDFTGAVAPPGKVGKREIKERTIELAQTDHTYRAALREAIRK